MFDYSIAHWSTFFIAAFLLNVSPGPDMAYVVTQTLKGGRAGGFFSLFGVWSGALIHIILSVVGLSAILLTSATAFTIVKWIGAAYLIWLGLKGLVSSGSSFVNERQAVNLSRFGIYKQGILVSILNPKVAIFFIAFLPQFVVPGAGPESAQLFLHGILILFVAAIVEIPVVLISDRLVSTLNTKPALGKWIDRSLGALFVSFGARLAFATQE